MQKQNRGKDFESCIRNSLESVNGVSLDRLPDPMGGYAGVRNICDFSVFQSPDNFYLECKSLYGNTLNYKSSISENQWLGLQEKSIIPHCIAGVCVWFMDYDLTVFIKIQDLVTHRNTGAKSLNIDDIMKDNGIPHIIIDGIKKRVLFKYLGEEFLYKLHQLSKQLWGCDTNDQ